MRRRGTGRFALAFVACLAAGDFVSSTAVEVGAGIARDWGVVPVVLLVAFGLGPLFTMVYDGRSAVGGLLAQSQAWRRNMAYSPTQQTIIRPSAKG